MLALDASVLIALAKIRRLKLVKLTYDGGVIGPVVFDEVVTAGKRVTALGVEQVEHGIQAGWIRLVRSTPMERRIAGRLLRTSRLHRGEAETLAFAKQRDLIAVLDDKEARSMANMLGVGLVGSAGLLLEAFYSGHQTLAELEDALLELAQATWLSAHVVATVLKLARGEKR